MISLWHFIFGGWIWFKVVTGIQPSSSPQWYNAWSGFLSCLSEVTLIGLAIGFIKHQNCGVHRCWRIGHYDYDMNGVKHKVCKKHHPALGKGHKLHHHHLLEHHAATYAITQSPGPAESGDTGSISTT